MYCLKNVFSPFSNLIYVYKNSNFYQFVKTVEKIIAYAHVNHTIRTLRRTTRLYWDGAKGVRRPRVTAATCVTPHDPSRPLHSTGDARSFLRTRIPYLPNTFYILLPARLTCGVCTNSLNLNGWGILGWKDWIPWPTTKYRLFSKIIAFIISINDRLVWCIKLPFNFMC